MVKKRSEQMFIDAEGHVSVEGEDLVSLVRTNVKVSSIFKCKP